MRKGEVKECRLMKMSQDWECTGVERKDENEEEKKSLRKKMLELKRFLAALSSFRSLVVGWLVGWSVNPEGFVKK